MYARPVNAPKPPPPSYTHEQPQPATTWTVTHKLNRIVAVTVLDVVGEEITGTVAHLNLNTIRVSFNLAVAGRAVIT